MNETDKAEVKRIVGAEINDATAFSTMKVGDTPTDAYQLVPRKYMTGYVTSYVATAVPSIIASVTGVGLEVQDSVTSVFGVKVINFNNGASVFAGAVGVVHVSIVSAVASSALGLAQKRNILYRVLASTTNNAVASVVGGSVVMPFSGSITGIGATVDTAGTTGTESLNVFNNATSILSTPITLDTTETTSRTASPPVIAFPNVATGDILTFQVDVVQTTPAKGLTFFLDLNRPQ